MAVLYLRPRAYDRVRVARPRPHRRVQRRRRRLRAARIRPLRREHRQRGRRTPARAQQRRLRVDLACRLDRRQSAPAAGDQFRGAGEHVQGFPDPQQVPGDLTRRRLARSISEAGSIRLRCVEGAMHAFTSHMTHMNEQTQVFASEAGENPLLTEWGGPFGVAAFGRIKPEHFRPAFARAFAAHAAEVAAIAGNAAAPTFANTIEALESSGATLTRAVDVFDLLAGAHTNDAILAIERELAPLKAKPWDRSLMDEPLSGRTDPLSRTRGGLALSAEQRRVPARYHLKFPRAGAALDAAAKARLADINERLATLGTTFSQNVLADEQS